MKVPLSASSPPVGEAPLPVPSKISPEQVTIAIEGWNADDVGGDAIFRQTISSLQAQTYPFSACEILVLIDSEAPPEEEQWLGREVPKARVIRVPRATYYRLKNRAMTEAHGEFLVFADSDVRYDPGWLEALLGSFRPEVELVVGHTRYEPGFGSRTLDLCDWNATRHPPSFTDSFYANNLAVRRALFPVLNFREDMGQGGGGAPDVLKGTLAARGIRPWFCGDALAWHYRGGFVSKRLRLGAYLIHHRRLAPIGPWPWLARVRLLGPPLVVAGTMMRAWGRAWRLRSTLPGKGLSFPLYVVSIAAAKSVEVVGAYIFVLAPASILQRLRWLDALAVDPLSPTVHLGSH